MACWINIDINHIPVRYNQNGKPSNNSSETMACNTNMVEFSKEKGIDTRTMDCRYVFVSTSFFFFIILFLCTFAIFMHQFLSECHFFTKIIIICFCLYMFFAALPTCIGASFYYAIKFMTFDACIMGIGLVCNRYDFEIQRDIKNATAGLCAGIIGNTLTYPNNCIRKRMQTAHVTNAIGVKSAFPPLHYIDTANYFYYHEGGFKRFYKGFGINLCRNAPNTAIQFVVYKRLQSLWNERHDKD